MIIPFGTSAAAIWNTIASATGAATFSNAGNATTFNQTSAVNWTWANTTAATSGTAQSSPILNINGTYWTGSVSAADSWTIQNIVASGTNGASTLTLSHSGSSGNPALQIPAGSTSNPSLLFGTTGVGLWGASSVVGLLLGTGIGGSLNMYVGSTAVFSIQANTSSGNYAIESQSTSIPFAIIGSSTTAGREQIALGGAAQAPTSGTAYCVTIGDPSTLNNAGCVFQPTSGSANFNAFTIQPTINQTGGASGTCTDILVNAKETAVVGTHNFLDLQGGSAGTTSKFTIKNSGVVTKYNTEVTAGVGHSYLRGVTSQKSETGADASLLSVTPASAAGVYRIAVVLSVSAASAATLGWTATWTDGNGHAQAPTNLALSTAGSATIATTVSAAANGTYYGEWYVDINNAGTAIVIKTTFSGTSIAYLASATVERIA